MTTCWVLSDGAAGNVRQASALAHRLAANVRIAHVQARPPWSWFAPHFTLGGMRAATAPMSQRLSPPWPELAVGCGRTGALFTRLLRRQSRGACRSVQILDPRADPRHWDLVVAPAHDDLVGDNVINPLGSLNPVDDAWLAEARAAWSTLEALPPPRIGVLVGGPRRGTPLDDATVGNLLAALSRRQHREGGSLMVVTSRRTPAALMSRLARSIDGVPGMLWCGEADGDNPYAGILAWADRLFVTADSVNMLSEACAVGCPVHAARPRPSAGRLLRFHQALRERGLLHDLDDDTAPHQTPLRETDRVADEVARRLAILR